MGCRQIAYLDANWGYDRKDFTHNFPFCSLVAVGFVPCRDAPVSLPADPDMQPVHHFAQETDFLVRQQAHACALGLTSRLHRFAESNR